MSFSVFSDTEGTIIEKTYGACFNCSFMDNVKKFHKCETCGKLFCRECLVKDGKQLKSPIICKKCNEKV